MKYNYFFLTILLLSFVSASVTAEDKFIPWNADVAIADENSAVTAGNLNYITGVYSGPQGGAYFLIRFFQVFISPQDGPSCRFTPTCSSYGKIAVLRYGAFFGSVLAGERLIRCNPFTSPGNDPVPESIFK